MIKVSLVVVVVLALAACDARVEKVSQAAANDLPSLLTYMRDNRTGYCFAAIQTAPPADYRQRSMSITWVPCRPDGAAP